MTIPNEYVQARQVLLDALDALEPHRDNLILIGAQAVYLHTGDSDLRVPPMTTDADLAINAADLSDSPEISGAMKAAGFTMGPNPGQWRGTGQVAIDLMVATNQAGTKKRTARAARLDPHSRKTARIAKGLEPSLVDNSVFKIEAFSPEDFRVVELRVAGPAALFVAKMIKISERLGQVGRRPDRLRGKDALDAFRLLQATQTQDLVAGFRKHKETGQSWGVSKEAIKIARLHTSSPEGRIVQLAVESAEGDPTVAPSFVALAEKLSQALTEEGW